MGTPAAGLCSKKTGLSAENAMNLKTIKKGAMRINVFVLIRKQPYHFVDKATSATAVGFVARSTS